MESLMMEETLIPLLQHLSFPLSQQAWGGGGCCAEP